MGSVRSTRRRPGPAVRLGWVAGTGLGLLLVACGGDDDASEPDGPTPTSTSPTSTPEPVAPGARYVALGSSFASGMGIPTQGPCGRSDRSYPSLVAAELRLDLVDVTCAGATTANLLDQPQGDEPPQTDAVTPETALVTITVGGNDVHYSTTTLACGAPENCLADLDTAAIDTAMDQLPDRLASVARAVRERAPDARIVLVTYPEVVPTDDPPCAEVGLEPDEAGYVAELGRRLDQVFHDAAASDDLLLVDAYTATTGHGPCAPNGERWVTGADGGTASLPYHPTAAGHRGMADLVTAQLRPG